MREENSLVRTLYLDLFIFGLLDERNSANFQLRTINFSLLNILFDRHRYIYIYILTTNNYQDEQLLKINLTIELFL